MICFVPIEMSGGGSPTYPFTHKILAPNMLYTATHPAILGAVTALQRGSLEPHPTANGVQQCD